MALRSHKRDNARRRPRPAYIAGALAVLATGAAVTVGVVGSDVPSGLTPVDTSQAVGSVADADRAEPLSRSATRQRGATIVRNATPADLAMRPAAVEAAIKGADTKRWTTDVLNLWTRPDAKAKKVGELDAGKQVPITGRAMADRVEIVVDGQSRWVTAGYLDKKKPVVTGAGAGLSMEPCPDSSVESGLTSDAIHVYRSVCHAFPQITTYGGRDPHGEHADGRAIDIMTSDKALGDQIAAFLQAHAAELNLYDIIWWSQIWTPVRASEGWRSYSGYSPHTDHVHVAVN